MKKLLILSLFMSGTMSTHALLISEIMSNPTGDDGGREWVELYNDTTVPVDISALTISIKGGAAIVTTPLSGGTTLNAGEYAIIASTVSGVTKFLQDYPLYNGSLFKSSISLVNTGVTSIEIKLNGVSLDILSSYTAAKEGMTLSRVNGSFIQTTPTPGSENSAPAVVDTTTPTDTTATTTTEHQVTVAQMSPPSPDIILYMPFEKTVVAGAETEFSTYGMTRAGKTIDGLTCTWAFGDGGQAVGTSTKYRYAYAGRYVAQVEGTNGYVAGTGRMTVRVVPPDIAISAIASGKYGTYVDITNPNPYDLDFSQWKLLINGSAFPFPKNTLLAAGGVTHFSGVAMGFASSTISSGTVVQILFPNQEEVTKYIKDEGLVLGAATTTIATTMPIKSILIQAPARVYQKVIVKTVPHASAATSTIVASTTSVTRVVHTQKDTRIVAWFKGLFGR
ncbi:MAG: lamin tail domain-containing protein [Candidatus Paceibacterota bacterium]